MLRDSHGTDELLYWDPVQTKNQASAVDSRQYFMKVNVKVTGQVRTGNYMSYTTMWNEK